MEEEGEAGREGRRGRRGRREERGRREGGEKWINSSRQVAK